MGRYFRFWNQEVPVSNWDALEIVGDRHAERSTSRGALLGGVLALGFVLAGGAQADERAFTFSYEATTMPKGRVEYEQWVTWKARKGGDPSFDRLDVRHEIEYGVTDTWQVALYLSDWRYEDGNTDENDGVRWRDAAVETIYQLADPTADPLGVALYGEVKGGDELLALEAKLILQKNLGRWIASWNGTLEAEWEGKRFDEDKGELEETVGLSYQINPRWRIGAEFIHGVEYADWSQWQDHVAYLGPNGSFRSRRWWVTVTPTFQVTDVESEADFQTRVLFGVDF